MKKKWEKTIEYKIFAQRLSDDNIEWLFKEKAKYKSWNLLFNNLINKQKQNGEILK